MGDLSDALARLRPPLRVEAFNNITAGKPDFMAMVVRDYEAGVSDVLAQQMQDQTAADICFVVNRAADELSSLREAYGAAVAFIESHVADPDITAEMQRNYAEYRRTRALLSQEGGEG